MRYPHELTGTPIYTRWGEMCHRAKDEGVSVCAEWADCSKFLEYCLDNGWSEDLLVCRGTVEFPGVGDYAPGNVFFMNKEDFTVLIHSMKWEFVNPEGETIVVRNMAELCRDFKLSKSAMHRVAYGVISQHKGWTVTNVKSRK